MNKKIIVIFVASLLLSASFIALNAVAKTHQIDTSSINNSQDDKLKNILDYIFENEIISPDVTTRLKHVISSYYYNGEILPGTFIFDPCNPINIEGIGIVDYDGALGFLALEDGIAELDNSFSRTYDYEIIAAVCIFESFDGEIEGSAEEMGPLQVTGQSGWFCLVEFSYLLELSVDPSFFIGDEIPITVINVDELQTFEIVNPKFYAYRTILLSSVKVYEETIPETWILPPSGTEAWTWDQKDQGGNQVAKGNYVVGGEFNIDGRDHPVIVSIEIKTKSRNANYIQTMLCQIFNEFPVIQRIIRSHFLK